MFISQRIEAMAPGNSRYYRLKMAMSDGTERVFPPEAGAFFKIGESPYGVPNNQYSLAFYDEGQRLIPYHEQKIHINLQLDAHQQSQGQLNLHLLNAKGRAANLPQAAVTETATAPDVSQSRSPVTPEPRALDEADLDLRRHLHAMDLEERQQEFINAYSTHRDRSFQPDRDRPFHRIVTARSTAS